MILVNKLKKLKGKGLKEILILLQEKIVSKVYGYYIDTKALCINKRYNYKLVPMTLEILENIKNDYKCEINEIKYKILKNRIKYIKKEIGFVVQDENENFCGYFHLATQDTWDSCSNSIVRIDSDMVYLFDDYTFEQFRGKGVHSFSIIERLFFADKQGYTKAVVNIVLGNFVSEKAYQKIGFKKYIEYTYLHILKFKKTFIKKV